MIIILIFNLPTSSELADFLVFLVFALLLLGTDVAFLKCKAKVLLKDSHIDFHTILCIYRQQSYFCARETLKLSIAGQTDSSLCRSADFNVDNDTNTINIYMCMTATNKNNNTTITGFLEAVGLRLNLSTNKSWILKLLITVIIIRHDNVIDLMMKITGRIIFNTKFRCPHYTIIRSK